MILHSSLLTDYLANIENGIHYDDECDSYCKRFEDRFDQVLPECRFKGNRSKIQGLITKVHVNADGTSTEILFDNICTNPVSEPECVVTWKDSPKGPQESTNTKMCSHSSDSTASEPMSCEFNNDAIFKCEGLSIFTCKNNQTVGAVELKKYIRKHWENILKRVTTILIICGVHGEATGKVGPNEDNIGQIKDQVGSLVVQKFNCQILLFNFTSLQ